MNGSDQFSTKINNQIKPINFFINQSNPTDKEGLERTEPNQSIRFGPVG